MPMGEATGFPPDPPAGMADALAGYHWLRITTGESGGTVDRLVDTRGAADLFLKQGVGPVAGDIVDEAARLRWLAGRVAVPRLIDCGADARGAWILTEALPGRTAYQCLAENIQDGDAIVDVLADFLRRLHRVSIAECPFDSGHQHRLAAARRRLEAGWVDVEDFDEARQGMTADQLWHAMIALLPLDVGPVLTHGDFSLDNVLIAGGRVTGCIDVARAGVADRYQDIAILWNCLGEFGTAMQRRFVERYGITTVDERRLRFHLILDEFF